MLKFFKRCQKEPKSVLQMPKRVLQIQRIAMIFNRRESAVTIVANIDTVD